MTNKRYIKFAVFFIKNYLSWVYTQLLVFKKRVALGENIDAVVRVKRIYLNRFYFPRQYKRPEFKPSMNCLCFYLYPCLI
ncbi:hypothetical protein BIY37_11650 [Candidatus Brocadia sapporoensis]|uniref:Uncharacterized protein n=1 Tax=Candidatus Brocadia sapporoensis TaxID=392547 RepID=A0A1V6LXL7_9BACT|nr:hypothetical protein BIY37_11650 [Candidatus Brocadia sapporoensis]